MSENLYRAFSVGLNKRQLIKADENYIDTVGSIINKNPDLDYYESLYLYNQEHFNQFKKTHTLSGISDNVTDKIVFDFDSKSDLKLAQTDAKELYGRLVNAGFSKKAITTYFSGSKGLHIELKIDSLITKETLCTVLDNLTGGLPTFDVKIRDNARLFRFPLTKHPGTNKYKIPLTEQELNDGSIEEIQKAATDVDFDKRFSLLETTKEKTSIPPKVLFITKKEKKVEKVISTVNTSERPDLSRKPKHLTAAKYVLQQGYFSEGERNEACMILASTYKYLGYDQEHTYNIIKATLRMRCTRLELPDYDKKELWNTIIQPIYSPTWKGGTFSEEDGLLKATIDRYDLDKISLSEAGLVELKSLAAHYTDFATNIDANTIKLGIDEIDQKVRITTGMLVSFLAAPGAGKTSISLGILNTLSKNGEKGIFFSMDMAVPQVYQRLIQKHTGHTSNIILNNFKNQVDHEIEKYQKILGEEYKNIKFCFKTGLNPKQVEEIIKLEERNSGKKIKLALYDYLECFNVGVTDPTQAKAVVATALKDLGNELGICNFLLTQPAKISGDPSGELNSYTQIKGSGVVGEASSVVITLSRPGFSPKNPEDDNFATINVVKNRLGELSSTDLHWDGLTGNIRSLSHEEEADLKALRSDIAAEKQANKREDMF